MAGFIGITGTPGTGKKSIAPLVAAEFGLRCLGLNDIALSHGLIRDSEGETAIDTRELRSVLRGYKEPAVLYGHLLPYSIDPVTVRRVAVLRCEPRELKRRLLKRGYDHRKVVDNVEAELIGLESSDSFDSFGRKKAFEVDTTRTTPEEATRFLVGVVKGGKEPISRIDWTQSYGTAEKLRSLLSATDS